MHQMRVGRRHGKQRGQRLLRALVAALLQKQRRATRLRPPLLQRGAGLQPRRHPILPRSPIALSIPIAIPV